MWQIGRIQWFGGFDKKKNRYNNFGFITNGNEDIFVHKKEIKCQIQEIFEGAIVAFKLYENPTTAKKCAIEVNTLKNITDKDQLIECFYASNKNYWRYIVSALEQILTDEEFKYVIKNKINELPEPEIKELLSFLPNAFFLFEYDLRQFLDLRRRAEILIDVCNKIKDEMNVSNENDGILKELADCLEHISEYELSDIILRIPKEIKSTSYIFKFLNPKEQVDIIWEKLIKEQYNIWNYLTKEAKWLCLFKAAKENVVLPLFDKIKEEDKLVLFPMAIIWGKYNKQKKAEAFKRGHSLFESYIIDIAWESTEKIDLRPLLPSCKYYSIFHCEARPWPEKQDVHNNEDTNNDDINNNSHFSRAFCPCIYGPCGTNLNYNKSKYTYNCARIYADTSLEWHEWTLLELLENAKITPALDGLRSPFEYVPKLGGWINRLNDIRERLKCSKCGNMMKPNYKYAKYNARYNATVVSCNEDGINHDKNIYLNHCWACTSIIDSRECRIRFDDYYICLKCGSGPQDSDEYTQGDMCPQCGSRRMEHSSGKYFRCSRCGHEIKLPSIQYIKGKNREKILNILKQIDALKKTDY